MGVSSSSLLDDTKCNYIRGRTEAELNNFSPHYKRQYCVAFFSQLRDEVEQQQTGHTHFLKQKDPPQASELVYKDSVLHFDDSRKWKDRFVVVRADYSLELHDSPETFAKGTPARQTLQLTGGTVLTSEEKYCALVDKSFPDLNSSKEDSATPLMSIPGLFPVYLRLPFRRDAYFSFQEEDKQIRFISILSDCIRHQNHDVLKKMTCDVQAFLKAIHFYRQEKGHYESWEMLVGTECQVLANLVMEELLPSLQKELLPRLKGKKADRKRVWFATVEATYELVQDQLRESLERLKEESSKAAKQQEALIRSDMDQIVNSRNFLETKLQGLVSEPAQKFCSESVSPYLASILEELMAPVSSGFQAVRQRLEAELSRICKDFQPGGTSEELAKALEDVSRAQLEDCYQHVSVLKEQLQELRSRFRFSNSTLVVHNTQSHMQQLMENAVYTFELLLQSAMKNKPEELATVMEKAMHRVLKQYDYDSSTVRKRIFQEALVDITLPAIRRNLAPSCKTELQNYEQYVFADYTNFIQVENVYEDILLSTLSNEVNKVVKEAAALKKHNLFVDSTELHCVSQSSLIDSRTPPRSTPSSPAKVLASAAAKKEEEQNSSSSVVENGLENKPAEGKEQKESTSADAGTPKCAEVEVAPPGPASEVTPASGSDEPDVASSSKPPDVSSADAAEAESTNEGVTVAPTLCPTIIISKPASPTEDTQAPVHSLTEQSPESPAALEQNESAPDETEIQTESHAGPVQPDPADAQSKESDDVPAESPGRSSSPPETFETSNGLPAIPDLPAEGADSPRSAPIESEDCSDTEAEEPEDSVKAIRDLVVEIIEVEDVVSPCATGSETP